MPIQASDKMRKEESTKVQPAMAAVKAITPNASGRVYQIKPIECFNDYVAILQFRIETGIVVTGTAQLRQEGIIIGVGPDSRLTIGDTVLFNKSLVTALESNSAPYEGERILVMQEKNVLCKLPSVPFEMYQSN